MDVILPTTTDTPLSSTSSRFTSESYQSSYIFIFNHTQASSRFTSESYIFLFNHTQDYTSTTRGEPFHLPCGFTAGSLLFLGAF